MAAITALEHVPLVEFDVGSANAYTAVRMLAYIDAVVSMNSPATLAGGECHYRLLLEEAKIRRRLSVRWAQVTRIVPAEKRMASWYAVWIDDKPHDVDVLLEKGDDTDDSTSSFL